jgi:hypothetical protein
MLCQQSRSSWGSVASALLVAGLLWTPLTEIAAARALPRVEAGPAAQSLQSEPFIQQGRGFAPREPGFGLSVALSSDGTVALVAAAKSTYVLTRSGSTWVRRARLPDVGRVALSADGNTALIGGSASHVFARSGATWTEQATLSGGASDSALAADGKTVLMGNGAVFTRSGSSWTVQTGLSAGEAVALSADGNTALIGTGGRGSMRTLKIFTRSGAGWSQQFEERSGESHSYFFNYVSDAALSSDGSVALIGFVTCYQGLYLECGSSALVFTRTGSAWSKQDSLPGGASVALSADGNTALLGDPVLCYHSACERTPAQPVWAFTRSGAKWSEHGEQLLACELPNRRPFEGLNYGGAVAVSADGNTALIGDSSHYKNGSAYAFRRGVPLPPPPMVTKVSPKSEFLESFREVTIKGTNFCQANRVEFGSAGALIEMVSATSVRVFPPEGAPGIVDVTITTPGGTSAVSELDHFKFIRKPPGPRPRSRSRRAAI